MDKNKFEKAKEIDQNIYHLNLRLEDLKKFNVNGSTVIEISDGDRNRINVYGDQAFIKKVFDDHVSNMEAEIADLQSEFDAL